MTYFSRVRSTQMGAMAQSHALGWVLVVMAATGMMVGVSMAAQILDSMLLRSEGRGM